MELGMHMLDIVLHLLGEPQVRTATAATYAEFGPRGRGGSVSTTMSKTGVTDGEFDVEDLSTAFLRLAGGATLLLESSWAQWVPEDLCYVTVYGADGGAAIDWVPPTPKRSFTVWTEQAGQPEVLRPALPPDGDMPSVWQTSSLRFARPSVRRPRPRGAGPGGGGRRLLRVRCGRT
jgi:predicted dehydrogenase